MREPSQEPAVEPAAEVGSGGSSKHKHKKEKHKKEKDKHKHRSRRPYRDLSGDEDEDNTGGGTATAAATARAVNPPIPVPERPRRKEREEDGGTPESGEIVEGPPSPSEGTGRETEETAEDPAAAAAATTAGGEDNGVAEASGRADAHMPGDRGRRDEEKASPSQPKARSRQPSDVGALDSELPSKRQKGDADGSVSRQTDRQTDRHSDKDRQTVKERVAVEQDRGSARIHVSERGSGRMARDPDWPPRPERESRGPGHDKEREGERGGRERGAERDKQRGPEKDMERDRGGSRGVGGREDRERSEREYRDQRRDGREPEGRGRGGDPYRSVGAGAGSGGGGGLDAHRSKQPSRSGDRGVDPRDHRDHRNERTGDGGGGVGRRCRSPGVYRSGRPGRSQSGERRRRDDGDRGYEREERGRKGTKDSADGSSPEVPPEVAEKLLRFEQGALDEADEEQRLIEERRKRLQAIKEKHQHQAAMAESIANPTAAALLQKKLETADGNTPRSDRSEPTTPPLPTDGDRTPEGDRESSSDSGGVADGPVLDIWDNELAGLDDADSGQPGGGMSRQPGEHTEAERLTAAAHVAATVKGTPIKAGRPAGLPRVPRTPPSAVKAVPEVVKIEVKAAEEAEEEEEVDDMFAEVVTDELFGGTAPGEGGAYLGAGGGVEPGEDGRRGGAAMGGALADAYDDNEGYYNFQVGEMMDGRYEVIGSTGKGVFSSVVRARDMQRKDETGQHPEVAIKLIRSNDIMHKAAQLEQSILKQLGAADPDNRKHCIKLLRCLDYRNHFCLVFEPMAMNLRDLTKKYGRNKGLNIEAVQLFTCQLLMALRHLRKNEILHADIKPDNILINQRHNKVKICDFGSAMRVGDNDFTPYLVSRFYRAPEVILGLKYEFAMDMWSIGCVVYELFTGRILFPGRDNNEMLRLMMEVKGPFTKKMLKKGVFVDKHFENDPQMSFALMEDDPISKTRVRRLIPNPTVKHSCSALLSRCQGDKAKVAQLADLLEKMMALEPERRIDPDTALRHPFVKDYLPKKEHTKKKHKAGH